MYECKLYSPSSKGEQVKWKDIFMDLYCSSNLHRKRDVCAEPVGSPRNSNAVDRASPRKTRNSFQVKKSIQMSVTGISLDYLPFASCRLLLLHESGRTCNRIMSMKLRTIQEWYYRCTNAYNSSEISAVVQLLKLDGCCGTLLESLVTHGRMPSFMTSLRMIVGRKMKMWQMRRSTTRRT